MCENEEYVISNYGTITSDEVMLAGGNIGPNKTFYLFENAQNNSWWTLSLNYFTSISIEPMDLIVSLNGIRAVFEMLNPSASIGVRHSITLISGTTITGGVGTKDRPYIIN